ncbi:MAG: Rrf2 family transcriptional regulator [Alphaproteobacteria bacterium]
MQLSTKGRYAVLAMVELARHDTTTSLPLSAIAERQQISTAYLEQLFMKLRRGGLVKAIRGPKGGYRLALQPSEISIASIMAATDENVRMNRCSPEHMEWCLGSQQCAAHNLWEAMQNHIANFLEAVTLQNVLDDDFSYATEATAYSPQNNSTSSTQHGKAAQPEEKVSGC